ncbi:hypothetical protein ACIP4Y_32910 [Streptomyces sp. NPDC088810]
MKSMHAAQLVEGSAAWQEEMHVMDHAPFHVTACPVALLRRVSAQP